MVFIDDGLLAGDNRVDPGEIMGQIMVDILPPLDEEAIIKIAEQEGLEGIGAEAGMWKIAKSLEIKKSDLHGFLRDLSGGLEVGAATKYSQIDLQDGEPKMEIATREKMRVRYVFPGLAQKEIMDDWQFVDISHTDSVNMNGVSGLYSHVESLGLPQLMLAQQNRKLDDYQHIQGEAKLIRDWESVKEPPTIVMVMHDAATAPKYIEIIDDLAHDPGVAAYIQIESLDLSDESVRLDMQIRVGHTAFDKAGIQKILDKTRNKYMAKELVPPNRAADRIRKAKPLPKDKLEVLKSRIGREEIDTKTGRRNMALAEYAAAKVAMLERVTFGEEAVGFRDFAELMGTFNFLHYEEIPTSHEETVKGLIQAMNEVLKKKGMERLTELPFVAMAAELLAMGSPAIMVNPGENQRIEMVPTGTASFREYVDLIKQLSEMMQHYPTDKSQDPLQNQDWRRRLYENADQVYQHFVALRAGIKDGKSGKGAITIAARKLGKLRAFATDTIGYYLAQATGALLNGHHQISWNAGDVGNQSFETGLSAGVFTATQRDGRELGWKADMRGIDVFFVMANYMAANNVTAFGDFLESNQGIRVSRGKGSEVVKLDSAKQLWRDYLGSLHGSTEHVEGMKVPQQFWERYVDATEDMASYVKMREAASGYLLALTRWLSTDEGELVREILDRVFPEMMSQLCGWRLASMQYYAVLSMMGLYAHVERGEVDVLSQDQMGNFTSELMAQAQQIARHWQRKSAAHHAEMVSMMVGAPLGETLRQRGPHERQIARKISI